MYHKIKAISEYKTSLPLRTQQNSFPNSPGIFLYVMIISGGWQFMSG
jgi:hypothetical protein